MVTRFLLFFLALLTAGAAGAAPQVTSGRSPASTTSHTVTFRVGDTTDSEAIPVSGFCSVRYQQASDDDASLYAVTTADTAASSGTLIGAFTSSTTTATTFTAGTRWVKAVATDATAGGSVMTIDCAPLTGGGGAEWEDAGSAIVALDGHDVIVGGDEDETCETGEICFDEGTGIVTAEGFVARDQASGSNFNEFDDNPTTVPSAPSGANVRLYTTDDGELYKKDAGDGTGDGNRLFTAQDFRRYPFYFSDFLGPNTLSTADPSYVIWDMASISSGTISGQPGTSDHPGWYRLLSALNTSGSGISILTNTTAFLLSGGEVFEAVFTLNKASGTDLEAKIGFHDVTAAGLPNDGVLIRFNGSLTPSCVAITGGTGETSTAFSAPITLATWYRALITINADATEAYCSIFADGSDTPIETITITEAADIPTSGPTGSGFSVHITDGATAATSLANIDWIAQYSNRRLAR